MTLQANKKTTISGDFNAGATSLTLASAAFTNFTNGYLVVDYDNDSKFEIIKCTVTGTAVTSITRAQDGTSDVDHSSGAKIGFMFVPSHYAALVNGSGLALTTAPKMASGTQKGIVGVTGGELPGTIVRQTSALNRQATEVVYYPVPFTSVPTITITSETLHASGGNTNLASGATKANNHLQDADGNYVGFTRTYQDNTNLTINTAAFVGFTWSATV